MRSWSEEFLAPQPNNDLSDLSDAEDMAAVQDFVYHRLLEDTDSSLGFDEESS